MRERVKHDIMQMMLARFRTSINLENIHHSENSFKIQLFRKRRYTNTNINDHALHRLYTDTSITMAEVKLVL